MSVVTPATSEVLWYTCCPVPTAFGVAARRGWLDDELTPEGVRIRSLATATEPATRQAHFDHAHGNLFRHGGNIPPLVSRSRGRDLRLIGLSWTDHSEPVLTLPDSGIAAVGDLRGRRLSLPRHVNDSVDFWRATVIRGFGTALAVAGLTAADVEWVDVVVDRTFVQGATDATGARDSLWDARSMLGHQCEEVAALLRGEVDAIFSQGAVATSIAASTGARVVIDNGTLEDRTLRINGCTPLALTVTGDLLATRPDLVARVLARTLRAAEWSSENPVEAARILAAEVGLAEELTNAAFSPRLARQLSVGLEPGLVAALASQRDLLLEHGFLAGPVDIDAFIAPEPLETAHRLLADDASTVSG